MVFPFTLSLVFTIGLILVGALLALMAWRSRNPRESLPEDLPVDPATYGPAQTNRWLRLLRLGFVGMLLGALVMHGYWIYGAPGTAEYDVIAARDQRERRLASAGLRGWVFDRTGKADRALVRYRLDNTNIIRTIAYRAARAGIVTGVLLAVARISGETAPLIFTALGNDNLRFNVLEPLESLPTSIYKFAGSAYPDLNALAWTGALLVTAAVLILSIVARLLTTSKKSGH